VLWQEVIRVYSELSPEQLWAYIPMRFFIGLGITAVLISSPEVFAVLNVTGAVYLL